MVMKINELEMDVQGEGPTYFRIYSDVWSDGLKNTTQDVNQNSRLVSRDF